MISPSQAEYMMTRVAFELPIPTIYVCKFTREIGTNLNFHEINVMGVLMSDQEKIKNGMCPCCDSPLAFQEGCMTCISCGWGACDG